MKQNRRLIKTVCIVFLIFISMSSLADTVGEMGTVLLVGLPITTMGVALKKNDTDGLKQYLLDVGVTTALTLALKYSVNEKRPNGGSNSFPSEHAAFAFSTAGYLWRRYGYQYGIPAALAAGFVGYSRVDERQHYWHDVIAGSAIGVLSSVIFVKPLQINCSTHGATISYVRHFDV